MKGPVAKTGNCHSRCPDRIALKGGPASIFTRLKPSIQCMLPWGHRGLHAGRDPDTREMKQWDDDHKFVPVERRKGRDPFDAIRPS